MIDNHGFITQNPWEFPTGESSSDMAPAALSTRNHPFTVGNWHSSPSSLTGARGSSTPHQVIAHQQPPSAHQILTPRLLRPLLITIVMERSRFSKNEPGVPALSSCKILNYTNHSCSVCSKGSPHLNHILSQVVGMTILSQ